MKVGYSADNYLTKRNIINVVPNVDYVNVYDINKILSKFAYVTNKISKLVFDINDIRGSFNDLNLNRINILHLFNAISFSKTPWVTTFETIIPRFRCTRLYHTSKNHSYSPNVHDKKIIKALEVISSASCKKLIRSAARWPRRAANSCPNH